MSKLIINGGIRPRGEIYVSGSKNAALALIPATILVEGEVTFLNMPRISDVILELEIIKALGGEYQWLEENVLRINTSHISYTPLKIDAVKKLRGSILFLGPILAKFKKCVLALPGGDIIGARPIKTHLNALRDLGVEIKVSNHIEAKFKRFKEKLVVFDEISVTASELVLLFSALSTDYIDLRLIAIEPHVVALERFLQKIGCEVKNQGSHFVRIRKGGRLKRKITFELPFDEIETGTFIALAAATKGEIYIKNIPVESLDSILKVAKNMKVNFIIHKNFLKILPSNLEGTKIQVGLFPKFPTDLQPPFGVMATQAEGVTLIHDWMYENRFGYLKELAEMGANVEILDPHRAIIIGPTPLHGTEVKSLDIRAGIALVIAGLCAKGRTIIHEAEKIDRGYQNIVSRLQNLGLNVVQEQKN